jgi:hypothetical protein
MPNIRVKNALEKIDAEINRVGEHIVHYSGISRKDADDVRLRAEDIAKTASQIAELARLGPWT